MYLEDFHPVALLHRMMEFFDRQKLYIQRSGWTTASLLSHYTDVLMRLKGEFNLDRSSAEFLDNETALESRFPQAFPEVWESKGFQSYLLERKTLHERRAVALDEEASDPMVLADAAPIEPDRFLTRDAVFARDDAVLEGLYDASPWYPLLDHDVRMLRGAVADWIVYGQRDTLDQFLAAFRGVFGWYKAEFPEESFWLKFVIGGETAIAHDFSNRAAPSKGFDECQT